MTKQIILEAETIEAIERALKLIESVGDVQITEIDYEEEAQDIAEAKERLKEPTLSLSELLKELQS